MINTNHITMNGIIVYIYVYDQLLSYIYILSQIPFIIPISHSFIDNISQESLLFISIYVGTLGTKLSWQNQKNHWPKKSLTNDPASRVARAGLDSPLWHHGRVQGLTLVSAVAQAPWKQPRGATGKPREGENPGENPGKVGGNPIF